MYFLTLRYHIHTNDSSLQVNLSSNKYTKGSLTEVTEHTVADEACQCGTDLQKKRNIIDGIIGCKLFSVTVQGCAAAYLVGV